MSPTQPKKRGEPAPIIRIAWLVRRVQAAGCEYPLSIGWIIEWSAQQIGLQRRWSKDAREVDDPIERHMADFERAFANDDPLLARRLRGYLHAVHDRAESLSVDMAIPECVQPPPADQPTR